MWNAAQGPSVPLGATSGKRRKEQTPSTLCDGLNIKCPSEAHVCVHLVPRWGRCSERLRNLQELESSWRKCIAAAGIKGYSLLHPSDFISLLSGIWRKIKQNKTEQITTQVWTTTEGAPATMSCPPSNRENKPFFLQGDPLRYFDSIKKKKKLIK